MNNTYFLCIFLEMLKIYRYFVNFYVFLFYTVSAVLADQPVLIYHFHFIPIFDEIVYFKAICKLYWKICMFKYEIRKEHIRLIQSSFYNRKKNTV